MNKHKINKELQAYQKEMIKQQERIDKLASNGADDADIRKQVSIFLILSISFKTINRKKYYKKLLTCFLIVKRDLPLPIQNWLNYTIYSV